MFTCEFLFCDFNIRSVYLFIESGKHHRLYTSTGCLELRLTLLTVQRYSKAKAKNDAVLPYCVLILKFSKTFFFFETNHF